MRSSSPSYNYTSALMYDNDIIDLDVVSSTLLLEEQVESLFARGHK